MNDNLNIFHVYTLEMDTSNIPGSNCKAIIQEGVRKGEGCKFPPSNSGYCGRHERNKTYDDGILENKKWCRFFFRGCNNTITQGLTCDDCIKKKHHGKKMCKHDGCPHHTKDTDYCKKHERDIYYIEEKEKGFKYCDIARGCFSICDGDKKSCNECLEKERVKDKERFDKRKELQYALKQVNSIVRICVDCGSEYNIFKTHNNHESRRCKHCNEMQQNQDAKRIDRDRNYKNEMFKNKERYYKEYINNALRREYEFLINFEEFSEIVDKECYYCHHNIFEETNGIDRVDNSKGYTKENTVSCCEMCNRMKSIYHPLFFLEKCKIIGNSEFPEKDFYSKWSQYYFNHPHNYTNYKKNSIETRKLFFDLTKEEWDILIKQKCYLCGYNPINGNGLDRVDNTIRGYTMTNVRPCCGSCNNMKNEIDLETLVNHCRKINEVWKDKELFNNISIIKKESKYLQIKSENRKVWKALGVYYTILANKEQEFYESYKAILTKEELEKLCLDVKKDTKEKALEYLSKLLNTLKVRRERLKNKF